MGLRYPWPQRPNSQLPRARPPKKTASTVLNAQVVEPKTSEARRIQATSYTEPGEARQEETGDGKGVFHGVHDNTAGDFRYGQCPDHEQGALLPSAPARDSR